MGAIQQAMAAFKPAVPSVTYATWNRADRSGFIGGAGDVAKMGGSTGSIRANQGNTAGKWYWEYVVSTSSDDTVAVGVASDAEVMTNWCGQTAQSAGYRGEGNVYTAGSVIAGAPAIAAGDVIGVALDMDGRTVGVYRNNVLLTTQSLGGTSAWFPCAGQIGPSSAVVTANFGATALAYAPPAGHNAGLYI